MKKLFLTSAIIAFVSCPAFATVDINADAETANCDNTVLHTYDGPTSLEADWTANTITLDWYNGNTKVSTNSCTYDGAITLPSTNPSKDGYTFAGWQVRAKASQGGQQAGQTLLSAIGGTAPERVYQGDRAYCNSEACYYCGPFGCDTSADTGLNTGEWKTEYDFGTTKGEYSCNTNYTCSCRVTGFKANGSNSYTVITSSWVAYGDMPGYCQSGCPEICANESESHVLEQNGLNSTICNNMDYCMLGSTDGCHCDAEEAGNEEGPEYWCESSGGTWDGEDCIY